MITCKNISLNINSTEILNDINISFEKKKLTCILGQSGSGKTSLLKVISCIYSPSVGELLIDDTLISNSSFKENKNKIYPKLTCVFQNFLLFPHLTVLENLKLILTCNDYSFDFPEIEELFNYFKLRGLLSKKVYEISTGQRQRIAFIRAILLKPKYLLLDEITSALDIETTELVIKYLNHLKKQDTCIITSTHSLGFCRKLADTILFMDNGKIIETGDISILQNPKSSRLKDFLGITN